MSDDDALRRRLAATDPAAHLPPADPRRVARLLEDTMDARTSTPRHPAPDQRTGDGNPGRGRLAWLAAAAAVVAVALLGFAFMNLGGSPTAPIATPSGSSPDTATADPGTVPPAAGEEAAALQAPPAATTVRCAVPSAGFLRNADTAFDGTVTAVDGRSITLAVSRWYRGGDAAPLVRVTGQAARLRAILPSAEFEVGERYLVSAVDGTVTGCGLSAPYAPAVAAMYAEAFGG